MDARKDNKIILTMSPEDLRSLADKMEEKWNNIRLGESTFVAMLSYKNPVVHLHLDQEYFHKLKKEEKQ